ncbi:MAG: enoyl-CoA hydratase-related protein, partial [Candidatus Binataceae bacterium]
SERAYTTIRRSCGNQWGSNPDKDGPVTYEDILYESVDGIATITINRPALRNAVRPKTYEELTQAMTAAANDASVGVVVLTGAGDKAFCSGGDISQMGERTPHTGRAHMRRLYALSTVMRMMDKPIIAKVRGFCVGGGNEINLFCDMTIASEDAKFGQTGPIRSARPRISIAWSPICARTSWIRARKVSASPRSR